MEMAIFESFHRPGVGLVFIGPKNDRATRLDHTPEQLLDLFLRRLRVGPSKLFFEDSSFYLLSGPHRAASPQLRIIESINEVGWTDQEVDVHGPVLAVLEGSKAIKDKRLVGRVLGTVLLMEKKTMSTEAVRQAPYRGVGDARLSCNLAKSRTGNEAVKHGFEEVASAEPVVSGKGL
jgi:hypothetical protein